MTNPQRRRLFIAAWPDSTASEQITNYTATLRLSQNARVTQIEHLHMTLAFLGSVAESSLPAIISIADVFPWCSHRFICTSSNYWSRQKLVWLGSRKPPTSLNAMVQTLRQKLVSTGLFNDDRAFVPHITLVRNQTPKPEIPEIAVQWRINHYALVESTHCQGSPHYRICRQWRTDS